MTIPSCTRQGWTPSSTIKGSWLFFLLLLSLVSLLAIIGSRLSLVFPQPSPAFRSGLVELWPAVKRLRCPRFPATAGMCAGAWFLKGSVMTIFHDVSRMKMNVEPLPTASMLMWSTVFYEAYFLPLGLNCADDKYDMIVNHPLQDGVITCFFIIWKARIGGNSHYYPLVNHHPEAQNQPFHKVNGGFSSQPGLQALIFCPFFVPKFWAW